METKLTLSLDKEVIEKAKRYVKANKTSLSKVVENYFYYLTTAAEEGKKLKKEKTPLTDLLVGSLGRIEIDKEKEIAAYLMGKYIDA